MSQRKNSALHLYGLLCGFDVDVDVSVGKDRSGGGGGGSLPLMPELNDSLGNELSKSGSAEY